MPERYRIALLGRRITDSHRKEAFSAIRAGGLEVIGCGKKAEAKGTGLEKLEFTAEGIDPRKEEMQMRFLGIASRGEISIALRSFLPQYVSSFSPCPDNLLSCYFRLICFDMDSTLIRAELMDELGEYLGIGERMRRITARTMRGEICFRESFTERVALLKGLETEVLERIVKSIPAAPGLEDAMDALRKAGIRTAIVTGGFAVFGRYLQKKYGFDDIFATDIEISEGKLTGRFAGPILDGERKARALEELCLREKISPLRCVAAGDGANDVAMLCRAGLSVAYHAGGLDLPAVLHAAGVFEPYQDCQSPFLSPYACI